MKIAIVGGWSDLEEDNQRWGLRVSEQAEFLAACTAIGRRLAEKQHQIIVGSEKPHSADPHVVRGYLSRADEAPSSAARILLIQGIAGEDRMYENERKSERYRGLFGVLDSASSIPKLRAAEKIRATDGADALITIGGLYDTYLAGTAALFAGKTIVPFASFGGASRELWQLVRHRRRIEDPSSDFAKLADEIWSDDMVDAAFRFGGLDRPRMFLGSSSRAKQTALRIKAAAESIGLRVDYWEDFETGQNILDQLTQASHDCQYAVLLLTPDEPIIGDEARRLPRSNVLFELGFFLNALGKKRTWALVQRGTDMPSDYGGVAYIELAESPDDASISAAVERIFHAGSAPGGAPG